MSVFGSSASENDASGNVEVSQDLNDSLGGEAIHQDTPLFVVNYYTSGETKCTFQLRNVDDDLNYSLFLDLLFEIVRAFTNRNTKRFCELLNPVPALTDNLRTLNQMRRWCETDDDAFLLKVRNKINSDAKDLISPYPAHGNITSLDVTVKDDFDPSGQVQRIIERNAADSSDTDSEASEDIKEEQDDCMVDKYPTDEEKEIDVAIHSNPESPCYYPTQIEMATILKQRIETLMEHYHGIANLNDAFEDVDFTVYTARYRMLNNQTEQRICHPDAGVLSREELMSPKEQNGKKRIFMYGHAEDSDMHFKQLRKDVQEKPNTLFVIIADECHWGITKDKDKKPSAHNLFINKWCEESPRNVVVVQISATPFNLLTQDSRLPEVRCLLLYDKVSSTRKPYEAGDLLVLDSETEVEERIKQTSKEVELHVVHWSEVEIKNFERGMRMKLKSTLSVEDYPSSYLKVSGGSDFLSAYHQGSPVGTLGITSEEGDATVFVVQGRHGIVTIKAVVSEEQVLTIAEDKSGSLKAVDNLLQPTQFKVKLDYGAGVVAFACSDKPDHYLTINEHGLVHLQPAKVERKCGVSIMKSKHDLGEVSFEFYMVQCGPMEVDMVGRQYVSLNFYLSTMNCPNKSDQKIREDEYFQGIVEKAKVQKKLSKTDSSTFTTDAMLCAEYCYYVLHMSIYESDDKVRQAVTAEMDKSPSAQFSATLESFVKKLKEDTRCIHHKVFEWVQRELCEKIKDDFKKDFAALRNSRTFSDNGKEFEKRKEELTASFVACLMHLSHEELQNVIEETQATSDVKGIKEELEENDCEKMVKIWNFIVQESETNSLIKSLIQSGKQGSGKMKISRAKSRKTANQLFYTLRLARNLASQENCFEIIRDYGEFKVKQLMTSANHFFKTLQSKNCLGEFGCRCSDLKLQHGRTKCVNCQHIHKSITQYEDLENLACVLILVDKGRMGDTFPHNFDCMDLRLSYEEGSPLILSTVIQELGRMCRYAKLSGDGSFVQSIPYALVGRQLFKRLEISLRRSPAMCAISCTRADSYMKNSKRKGKSSSSLRWLDYEADKESYDYQNKDKENNKHCNRILLQAEPQIGKTGTYLCLIKQLRQEILRKDGVSSTTTSSFEEGKLYLVKESCVPGGAGVSKNIGTEDWNFPYWKTIQDSPSLLRKPVGPGKYSIGGCFYSHEMEESPFILMKREGLSQQTKTGYHHEVENCLTAAVRAWHWYHFENCTECGRFLEGKEPVLGTIKVNIDGNPVEVLCSLPASRRPYKCLLEKLAKSTSTGECWTEDNLVSAIKSVPSSLYWIFHPSHRDDPRKCLMNYHHALQKENSEISYFQVAVVRSEKFQDYVCTWGKMLVIFQLPDQLPIKDEGEAVGPSEGGVGYARRFIQEMAFLLKLEYVFVIDDNVAVMSEAVLRSGEVATFNDSVVRNDKGVMQMEPCSFLRPLTYLQKIVDGKEKPDGRKQYEAHPLTEEFECHDFPLYSYTGPAKLFGDKRHESYGVLGLLRSVPNSVSPFAKTQVYAAVLLNVKSTVEKKVLYRPWPCWEDLRFNDDCDKEGLWVVKCNRFLFHKVQYDDWINDLVPPCIFQWTEDIKLDERPAESMLPSDLEESIILEHLRGVVNVEGEDNCFKEEIGISDSPNNDLAVSPMNLLEQLRTKRYTDPAFAIAVPVLFLAYSVFERELEDLQMLEKLYCLAQEKIVFVVSAKEARDEWQNNMTLDYIRERGIPETKTMRKRRAKFAIFSAADPGRHRLRWIVIEASFNGEGMSLSDASSSEGITEEGKHALALSDQIDSKASEKRGSKRSVEETVKGPKEYKKQTIPWRPECVQKRIGDPNTSANHLEFEQIRGISFQSSQPGSSKRITDSDREAPVTTKRTKVEDRIPNSTSANTNSPVTTVIPSLANSVKVKENGVRSAAQLGQWSNNGDARGAEPGIGVSKQQEGNEARQQGGDDEVRPASKRTRSQITGLTPEDPAYTRGTNEATLSIVYLWRDKMKQKGNEDIDLEKVESKLKNFKPEYLEKLDDEGFSALTKACSLPSMSPRVVSYLLTKKMVDVNSQLPDWFRTGSGVDANLIPGMSALSVALQRGNVKCVSTFMNRKERIHFERKDKKGNTALHYCLLFREAFEKLWPHYEKRNWRDMTNEDGKNPLDEAKEKWQQYRGTEGTNQTKKDAKNLQVVQFVLKKMDPEWKDQ